MKAFFRLMGALILASVGLILGGLATKAIVMGPLWFIPMGLGLGAGLVTGFGFVYFNSIERTPRRD